MKKLLAALIALFVLAALGISAVCVFPKPACRLFLSRLFDTNVYLNSAHFNPKTRTVLISGIKFSDSSGRISSVEEASFKIPAYIKFAASGGVFECIRIEGADFKLTKRRDKRMEMSGVPPPPELTGLVSTEPGRAYKAFPAKRVLIKQASLEFTDEFIARQPVITKFRDIDIVMDIKRPMRQSASFDIDCFASLTGEPQGRIRIRGFARPFVPKPDYDLTITARNIDLLKFEPYYHRKNPVHIDSGIINLEAKFFAKSGIQDSYYKAETFGLSVSPKSAFSDTFLGIPVAALIASLETHKGHIILDCYVKGPINKPKFSPGPISQERIITSTIDILKQGLDFFKGLK